MRVLNNRRGQGLVEYILVVVLMGIVAIGVIKELGKSTQSGFTKATKDLNQTFQGV